jgi:hypothetical protein
MLTLRIPRVTAAVAYYYYITSGEIAPLPSSAFALRPFLSSYSFLVTLSLYEESNVVGGHKSRWSKKFWAPLKS